MKYLLRLFPAGHLVMVVLVVALSIETLVEVFEFSRSEPALLPYAAAIGVTAAAMLAAWGVFVKLNRAAEELEPEEMQKAKQEVARVETPSGRANRCGAVLCAHRPAIRYRSATLESSTARA